MSFEIDTSPDAQKQSYEVPRLETLGHAREVVLSAGVRSPGDNGSNNMSLISGVVG